MLVQTRILRLPKPRSRVNLTERSAAAARKFQGIVGIYKRLPVDGDIAGDLLLVALFFCMQVVRTPTVYPEPVPYTLKSAT